MSKQTSGLSDEIFINATVGMILGIPILIGAIILATPFAIISLITGVPLSILLKNLLIFVVAVFCVWLFSKYQIIENGIVGLIIGTLVHTYFKWHSIACILIGISVVGLLFLVTYIKIGFWIKTILFSVIVTFIVFVCIYSEDGLFPLPDIIWKMSFLIIFFLENIFIRCTVAYNNKLLLSEYVDLKKEKNHNGEREQTELITGSFDNSYKN